MATEYSRRLRDVTPERPPRAVPPAASTQHLTSVSCDVAHCPATALVHTRKGFRDLALCGHDFDARRFELLVQGFDICCDARPALRLAEASRG